MKKLLTAVALVAMSISISSAEARDHHQGRGGHGGHGGRPNHERVVVVKNDCRHGRNYGCGCGRSYSYRPMPVREVFYSVPAYNASSVYFSNRNFAFGFSNFLW